MKARKKKTENQKAFQKERKRLLQAVRRAEKQGYIFPEDVVPKVPKRVTKKRLETIRKTKPTALYKTAQFVYIETGEIVPAEQRREEVKRQRIEKAKATRKEKTKRQTINTPKEKPLKEKSLKEYYPTISIIDTIRERLSALQRESKPAIEITARKNELLNIFEDTVIIYEQDDSLAEYEDYLKKHENEISDLLNVLAYDSDAEGVNTSFITLGRLLNVTSLSMNQAENLSMMSEYYNE